jgi:hypothetical protein
MGLDSISLQNSLVSSIEHETGNLLESFIVLIYDNSSISDRLFG